MGSTGFPGGAMARRPLHFIWIVDCSRSMMGKKIQSLNAAIQQAIPEMRTAARSNPGVEVLVRAVAFSSGARWHIAEPTPLEDLDWPEVNADGHTDMGRALQLVAEALHALPGHGLPPVLVLVTDGQPTDNFKEGLDALRAEKWGEKAVRVSIAIGDDADRNVLRKFIGNAAVEPLDAFSSGALVELIRWVSTVVLGQAAGDLKLPEKTLAPPPATSMETADDDVWRAS